jgi:hypothetical protein
MIYEKKGSFMLNNISIKKCNVRVMALMGRELP